MVWLNLSLSMLLLPGLCMAWYFPACTEHGHQPRMIHKFYGQVTNERTKDHLRLEWKDA